MSNNARPLPCEGRPVPPPPNDKAMRRRLPEAEERAVTREVLSIIAELRSLVLRNGELVVPEGISAGLLGRIKTYEPELRWAAGKPTPPGECWGRA